MEERIFSGHGKRPEVIVYADKVPAALIEPAAGGVDEAGGILFSDQIGNPHGIKLPPALVKGRLDGDGGKEFQVVDGLHAFLFPFGPELRIIHSQQLIAGVLEGSGKFGGQGGEIADDR